MKNSLPNIVFFSPNVDTPGGSIILFARLAQRLLKATEYQIKIVDFENGYIRNLLKKENYIFIPFTKCRKIELYANDLLICGLADLGQLDSSFRFHPTTRLFF